MSGAARPQVDNQKFYRLLGCSQAATQGEIEEAYQRKVQQHHPFLGGDGDAEALEECAKAYRVLGSAELRAKYDEHGEDGLPKDKQAEARERLMGALSGKNLKKDERTPNCTHPLKLTLEDIYTGTRRRVAVNRDRLTKDGKIEKAKKVLEVNVKPGTPDGHPYRFKGEADQAPKKKAGDVIFIIQQQKHKVFKRQGADLLMTKEITLVESLTGVDFILETLGGKKISIKSEYNQVVKHDQILTVEGKGMPFFVSDKESKKQTTLFGNQVDSNPRIGFGNLFVLFKVKFPQYVDQQNLETLKTELSGLQYSGTVQKPVNMDDVFVEQHKLKKYNNDQKNTYAQGGQDNPDEEEEYNPMDEMQQQCTNQ